MSDADLRQFLELVARMREAQKEYFITRDHVVLTRSKGLERQVDEFIRNVNQPGLF